MRARGERARVASPPDAPPPDAHPLFPKVVRAGKLVEAGAPSAPSAPGGGSVKLELGDALGADTALGAAAAALAQSLLQTSARNATLSIEGGGDGAPPGEAGGLPSQAEWDDLFLKLDGPEVRGASAALLGGAGRSRRREVSVTDDAETLPPLPSSSPQVWRQPLGGAFGRDVARARTWLREWAAARPFSLTTPVEVEEFSSGVRFVFSPPERKYLSSREEKKAQDDPAAAPEAAGKGGGAAASPQRRKLDGGLELRIEPDPLVEGGPARLRAVRARGRARSRARLFRARPRGRARALRGETRAPGPPGRDLRARPALSPHPFRARRAGLRSQTGAVPVQAGRHRQADVGGRDPLARQGRLRRGREAAAVKRAMRGPRRASAPDEPSADPKGERVRARAAPTPLPQPPLPPPPRPDNNGPRPLGRGARPYTRGAHRPTRESQILCGPRFTRPAHYRRPHNPSAPTHPGRALRSPSLPAPTSLRSRRPRRRAGIAEGRRTGG